MKAKVSLYGQKTKKELYDAAKKLGIKGRSKMSKQELIKTLLAEDDKKMQEDRPKSAQIIQKSREQNMPSSITEIKHEEKPEKKAEQYNIPEGYDIDKVVLMPVDPSKHFVYWEISKETKEKIFQTYNPHSFALKFFEDGKETVFIHIDLNMHNYYIHKYAPFKRLYVEFGVVTDSGFIPLKKSNEIVAPSDEVSELSEGVWLKRIEDWKKLISLSQPQIHASSISAMKRILSELKEKYQHIVSSNGAR